MSLTLGQWAGFLVCAFIAGYVQNITGFALSLLLLGLCQMFGIASVTHVSNATAVLSVVNFVTVLKASPMHIERSVLKPTMSGMTLGVLAGSLLLHWLSTNAIGVLHLLLGVTIVGCALTLVSSRTTGAAPSSPLAHAAFGLTSGVLGGLFSTAGPPLVFHFYRQPWPIATIRDTLLLMFGLSSSLRCVIMIATGEFDLPSVLLSATAVPLIIVQSIRMRRRPPAWPVHQVRRLTAILLCVSGGTILLRGLAAG
ncbi:MAG: TSUP family transporter [Burkholderiaceae bacterium]